jgi:hypothetical protein
LEKRGQHGDSVINDLRNALDTGGIFLKDASYRGFEVIRAVDRHTGEFTPNRRYPTPFSEVNGAPEKLKADAVSHEFFGLLGVKPVLGRVFTTASSHPD